MAIKTWMMVPVIALGVWYGPGQLVRWALSGPTQVEAAEREGARTGESGPRTNVVERTQVLTDGATCELENRTGRIVVRPSPDRTARLRAEIVADHGADAGRVRVDVSSDAKGLRARAVYPSRDLDSDVEVNLTLELPTGAALRLHTVSGDVEVRGARGLVEAQSVSGDLVLTDLSRGLRLRTVSGEVRLDGVAGPLNVTSVSGDISGRLGEGSLGGEVTTVSGEVDLRAARRAGLGLRTSTLSGEVKSDLGEGGARALSVNTTSGDIRVLLE